MQGRLSLVSACAVAVFALASGALLVKVAAREPASLACPRCHEPREGARCSADGAPLVRADLVVFGDTLTRLAAFDVKEKGLENPFVPLLGKDGLPDVPALEKLVADYKAARAGNPFTPFAGRLPLAAPPVSIAVTPEKEAIAALRSIATAESAFRESDLRPRHDYGSLARLAAEKLLDEELGGGKKRGYVFEAAPSTKEPGFRWYAKASTGEPGARSFFTNQVGLVYFATRPFSVDAATCDVPPGLELVKD